MDGTAFPNRLFVLALIIAATALAGCSGNSSTNSTDSDDPPTDQPPGDDAPASGSSPRVSLSASDSTVQAGNSVVLTWSSQNVTSCNASGGWSGSKAVQGSATVGPISQATTFTLSCTGNAGNAMAMLSVSVLGVVALEWQAPTENVDGSPLTNLAGFRIYYGQFSRSYTDELAVSNGTATRRSISLPSGSYYFAVTALDANGNESAYSNEVVRVVN